MTRLTRWLVAGLLVGGATRTHEKSRLRKGIPILVSTPGRLLDHLQNTSAFNVAKCRWLVLDEADRLMELGFEDTIAGIIKSLDGHKNLTIQATEQGLGQEVGGWDWSRKRQTILCSATIRDDVQKLAGTALIDPVVIKVVQVDSSQPLTPVSSTVFTPPSQLCQKYVIVPLKLRLVVLVALLRSLIVQSTSMNGAKIIVFISCTDSVDFHWRLLGGADNITADSDENDETKEALHVRCSFLNNASIYRLHGSLSTQARLNSLKHFASSASACILLCTSVASRGLDLPLVRAVVQYDLPTEGGVTEYIHRVGRTARVGKGGQAWAMVAPTEQEWIKWIEKNINKDKKLPLTGIPVEQVLQDGYGGTDREYEERATEIQLSFERWVLQRKEHAELARNAFLSHMRAYATHPSDEKHIFHVRHLHIGHLAKAFALRDAPKTLTVTKRPKQRSRAKEANTERRMYEKVRSQGKLSKRDGVMMSTVSEFQIAGGAELEKMARL